MKWSMIKSLPCCGTMCILHEDDQERAYDLISEADDGFMNNSANVVRFMTTSCYLQADIEPDQSPSFILYHDMKDKPFPRVNAGNVGVFIAKGDYTACMRELLKELSVYHALERGTRAIFELVAANAGMQLIIDTVATLYNAPASIIDNTYIPFAWSQSVTPRSERLRDTWNMFPLGKMSDDAVERMRIEQIVHPSKKIEYTRKWVNTFGEEIITNYLTMIYVNDIAVASFSVLYNGDSLSETQLYFLPLIAKALSLEMQKRDFYSLNKGTYFTNLLAHMFTPENQLRLPDLVERFSSFGYRLKKTKYIIHANILDFTLHNHQMHMVAGKLRELFANSVYIIRDTGVVLLMSRAHDDELTSSELSEWREVLLSMRVRVGVSNPFESPSDACRALEQARRALESGQRLNPSECLFRFEDYQFIDLAARLSESDDLSVYLYPPLKSIIDLDIQKRTNLAYTLYVYLQYARQSPKVCEKLSIHKNTLYYRLNRISTIMNLDFEESDAIQRQLMFSFEIIKFNGEFDRLPK